MLYIIRTHSSGTCWKNGIGKFLQRLWKRSREVRILFCLLLLSFLWTLVQKHFLSLFPLFKIPHKPYEKDHLSNVYLVSHSNKSRISNPHNFMKCSLNDIDLFHFVWMYSIRFVLLLLAKLFGVWRIVEVRNQIVCSSRMDINIVKFIFQKDFNGFISFWNLGFGLFC